MAAEPTQVEALVKRARKCVKRKDFTSAIEVYGEALQIDATHVGAHEGLAAACFMAEDFEGAIEHFAEVTKLDPWKASAYVNLGAVYNRLGEYSKAVEILQKGIQKDRKSAEAFYNIGIAYRHMDEPSMAVSAYREAIRLNPEMVEAHVNLANVYLEIGNNQQALVEYQTALELDPKFDRARRGIKRAESAIEKLRTDMSGFGRLVSESDGSPDEQSAVSLAAGGARVANAPKEWEEIREIVQKMINHADEVLMHLRTDLEPTLMALNRTVARGTDPEQKVVARHAEVHNAIEKCFVLQRQLEADVTSMRQFKDLFEFSDDEEEDDGH